MKRVIALLITALLILLTLVGCGNFSLGVGNYEFNTVHVCDYAGNCQDFRIKKWYDNDEGIEIRTAEAGSMFLSEGTYMLFENTCPLCKGDD